MRIDYATARKLCTASELALLEQVKPVALAATPARRAKTLLGQVRRHADKWRQQTIKQGNSTDGSASRSRTKQEMFEEAVARLTARIEKLNAPPPTAAKKVVKKAAKKVAKKKAVPAPPAKKAAVRKATAGHGKLSPPSPRGQISRKAAAKSKKLMTSGITTRRKSHIKAMGKRNQAARAARNR